MSDTQRLEAMSLAKEKIRREEETARKHLVAENAERQLKQKASDAVQTEAIFQYRKTELQGFKLKPTGYDVTVVKAPASKTHGIKSDGHDYFSMKIRLWGSGTNDFHGIIPVILTRCFRSKCEPRREHHSS